MQFDVEQRESRLDKYLALKLPRISRTKLQRLIKNGAVKVNGVFVIKPAATLRPHDRIILLEEKVLAPGNEEFKIEPEPEISLEVIYVDADILVVNKQAGLLVHPTLTQKRHTLANALMARYPEIEKIGESPLRPGIVHRLDQNTSGLIIVAKNQIAFEFIKKQFLERQVTKKYMALVEGVPEKLESVIEYDLRPSKHNRLKKVAIQKFEVTKKSRRTAKTFYKVVQTFTDKFALLEVSPQTGRTHQIRVHLSAIHHPVVGDGMYGSKSKIAKRQMLHAAKLEFIAPSGEKLLLEAPLPEDFKKTLEKISKE